MASNKMKKITLASTRGDFDKVIRVLLSLTCIEVFEPDALLPEDQELASVMAPEVFDLSKFNSNEENIVLLGTRNTLLLTGWLIGSSEEELIARLSEFVCAWDIESLSSDELEIAPVKLCCPWFFGKLRLCGAKPFMPLMERNR